MEVRPLPRQLWNVDPNPVQQIFLAVEIILNLRETPRPPRVKYQPLIYHSDPEMALEIVDQFRFGTDTGVPDAGREPLPSVGNP